MLDVEAAAVGTAGAGTSAPLAVIGFTAIGLARLWNLTVWRRVFPNTMTPMGSLGTFRSRAQAMSMHPTLLFPVVEAVNRQRLHQLVPHPLLPSHVRQSPPLPDARRPGLQKGQMVVPTGRDLASTTVRLLGPLTRRGTTEMATALGTAAMDRGIIPTNSADVKATMAVQQDTSQLTAVTAAAAVVVAAVQALATMRTPFGV